MSDGWEKLGPPKGIWANEWIKIIEIPVRLPTGVEDKFYAMDAPDGVAVLAVDDQCQVMLNRQYRPALREVILELPAGQLEDDETREEAARRETSEESGLRIKELKFLGSFYRNPAKDTGSTHVYFARVNPDEDDSPHQERYEHIESSPIPLNDLIAKVMNNEIKDVTTVFAVLMLQARLQRGDITL